jgi:hypothetical protein
MKECLKEGKCFYQCDYCDYTSWASSIVSHHMKHNHLPIDVDKNEQFYKFDNKDNALKWLKIVEGGCDNYNVEWVGPGWYQIVYEHGDYDEEDVYLRRVAAETAERKLISLFLSRFVTDLKNKSFNDFDLSCSGLCEDECDYIKELLIRDKVIESGDKVIDYKLLQWLINRF